MVDESKKKETASQVAQKLLEKQPETLSAVELQREMFNDKTYSQDVINYIEKHKSKYPKKFYLEVQLKKEPYIPNMIRVYKYIKLDCPSPTYDQIVYRYDYTGFEENLEYMWNIPDKQTCQIYRREAVHVANEEKWLLKNILDFYDGTLEKRVAIINGEQDKINNVILLNPKGT